tara:strand:+ start:1089 stop:2489 length:1401 start_codon:yes stop_codon:yes gene_type:complete
MASTIVSRTQSGNESAAGRKTWTFSCWFKKTKIISGGSNQELFGSDSNGARSNNFNIIDFNSNDHLDVNGYQSGVIFRKITNRKFRDCNAWTHLVVAFDTTQSTADDRIKIYINGVRETSFSTSTNPPQDHQGKIFAQNKVHAFGRSGGHFDGLISHCHATEGTAYAPTEFGETDSTTGEWKIKTNPSVSYGTNGFFLFKDDNSVNNQAGNSSGNFAVTAGTFTKTEDCPSNVFATLNPLTNWRGQSHIAAGALSKGNNTTGIGSSEKTLIASTIGVTSGKWYWEAKSDGVSKMFFGICNKNAFNDTSAPHDSAGYNGIYYYEAVPDFRANTGDGSKTTGIASITSGDILGFALDMDNWALYIHKNGTYMNSGDPTSGSSKTGAISELFNYGTWYMRYNEEVFASCYVSSTSGSGTASYNFGNGYFGTTAVATNSGNGYQDADGNGIMNYSVPTNYRCLCTKGLNQ